MLKIGSFALLPGQLLFLERPTLEDMEEPVKELIDIQRHIPWWIGDLVNYGLAIHGDDLYQIFPEDCSLDMLNRYAAMAKTFPATERHSELSYTHHCAVAKFEPAMRRALLNKASVERWNSEQLREHIKRIGA